MQNPHAKWRTEFARRLTTPLQTFEGVQAIVVAGSIARNYADEYSDVEIPIFWKTPPGDEIRHEIVETLKASFLSPYNGPACEDQLLIDGLQVDLWHITVSAQEAMLDAVLQANRSDLESLNAMDTIRCCVPLFGDEIVQAWKQRAKEYPQKLAEAIIRQHLDAFKIDQLSLSARRHDPTDFYAQLSQLQHEVFLVLLALNKEYFPTFKWMYRSLESMRVKPVSVCERLRQAFTSSYQQAIADTKQILLETVELVEVRHPLPDLNAIRRRLSYVREPLEKPINP